MSEYDDDAQYNYRNYMAGRIEERAAIVAWLRDDWSSNTAVVDASYEIESGEHLRATRTEPRHDEAPPPSPE